jgi:hypothetical protein
MNKYSVHIRPYVEIEFEKANAQLQLGDPAQAFIHLENAHVLGQTSTYLHVKAHVRMLKWSIIQKNYGEFLAQTIRIIGATTKTTIGLVPIGNTGGANVSPFKSMPLSVDNEKIIALAKKRVNS